MTQLSISVAVGTSATLMAIILLLLRADFDGRRPVVALMRWWIAARSATSVFILALLTAIALSTFASIPAANLRSETSDASVLSEFPLAASTPGDPQAWDALRDYAEKIGIEKPSTTVGSAAPKTAALPDVDSMLAKLAARLDKQPDDVRGWKMLAWSYLNTERPDEAANAYQTALKIDPDDIEIKKGLDAAKAAQTATAAMPSADPAASPTAQDMEAAQSLSDGQRNAVIRDMVDGLAARLESSPNDEDGWLRLMRSRATLGEKDAAKAALTKALETFAGDAAVKSRLTSAARELGVEGD